MTASAAASPATKGAAPSLPGSDFYLTLDVPLACLHPDVGYYYSRRKGRFVRLAPGDVDSDGDGLASTLEDAAALAEAMATRPSSHFLGGPGIDLLRHSFAFGPALEAPAGGAQLYHRRVLPGARLQLYACFLDRAGAAVPGKHFDAQRHKHVVYGGMFVGPGGGVLRSFASVLAAVGLEGWVVASGGEGASDGGDNDALLAMGSPFAKASLRDAAPRALRSALAYYRASAAGAERALGALGPATCISDDGAAYFGVAPQLVPSPAREVYPVVYAALNEPGCTSSSGPCELFVVHFQWPGRALLPCLSPDMALDASGFARCVLPPPPPAGAAQQEAPAFNAATVDLRTGRAAALGGAPGGTLNPRFLLRDQRVPAAASGAAAPGACACAGGAPLPGEEFRISVQGLNVALADAPFAHRLLQLYACARAGVPLRRLTDLDPADGEALAVHLVRPWLDAAGVLPEPTLQRLCAAASGALRRALDDPVAFDGLVSGLAAAHPGAVDATGIFRPLRATLDGIVAAPGGAGACALVGLELDFCRDADGAREAAFVVPVLLRFVAS
jgi:hypothetical protein